MMSFCTAQLTTESQPGTVSLAQELSSPGPSSMAQDNISVRIIW